MLQRRPGFVLSVAIVAVVVIAGCGPRVTISSDTKVVGVSQDTFLKAASTSGEDAEFFWLSSDPSVLRVASPGRGVAAWGLAPGRAEVTAEGTSSGAIGRITLEVVAEDKLPEDIKAPEDAFVEAARKGDLATVERFLADGVNVDFRQRRSGGMSALVVASRMERSEIVARLLDAGADPNLADDSGRTALMGAAYKGNIPIIEMLLAHGADPNRTETSGQSAFDSAYEGNNREAFRVLASGGARKLNTEAAARWFEQDQAKQVGSYLFLMLAFVWVLLFFAAVLPLPLYRLRAMRHRYYKVVSEEETAYVEVSRKTHAVKRKVQSAPGAPPVCMRRGGEEGAEIWADAEPVTPFAFHQHWRGPYVTYKRLLCYLRLCVLTVLSTQLFVVWVLVAILLNTALGILEDVPRDAIMFIWLAAILVPPFLFLATLAAFLRLQFSRPSLRRQAIAFIAGGVVILFLAELAFRVITTLVAMTG